MNKTERKVIEKLALSAYAWHLYQGLTCKDEYSLGEVIRYWRYAQEDPGGHCPQLYDVVNVNVFKMLENYEYNVETLEAAIARYVAEADVDAIRDKDDRVEVSVAQLPETFRLRAFPDFDLRVDRFPSYVDDSNNVQLVLERLDTHQQFGKGTVAEIQAQMLPTTKGGR